MNNIDENTHLIDTHEQDTENNDLYQYEFHDEKNNELIPDEELEHIHPDLDKSVPSQTMKSGITTIHKNDPEHIIDYPEYFFQ